MNPDDTNPEPTPSGTVDAPTAQIPMPWMWVPPPSPAPPSGGSHKRRALTAALLAGSTALSIGAGALISSAAHRGTTSTALVTTPQTTTAGSAPVTGATGGSPSGGPLSLSSITAIVDPAVVDITTTLAGGVGTAAGTGMVITSSGEVLTNNHVIADASSIAVQINGSGPMYTATVLGYDVTHDIALLQMQGVSGLTTVSLGNSSGVGVGDSVVAIGNALGAGGTPAATSGAVSALSQTITASDTLGNAETLSGLIELTAPIQPGDSGGPLVDATGKVIGIDTAAMTGGGYREASVSAAAYAIPINTAMAIVQQIQSGTSSATVHIGLRGILGVQVQDGSGSGVSVIGVQTGSPAASAGLAAGCTIVSVNGAGVSTAAGLGSVLQAHRVGDKVNVTWLDAAGAQHSAALALIAGPPA